MELIQHNSEYEEKKRMQKLRIRAKKQGLKIRTKRHDNGSKTFSLLTPSKNNLKIGDVVAEDLTLDMLEDYLYGGVKL